jgi:hypothetical protein
MNTQFYWQQVFIPQEAFTAQNGNAFGPDFLVFECGDFQNNMEGEVSSVELTFAIGSFQNGFIDRIIKESRTVEVQASKGDPTTLGMDFDWRFQGVVTDATITLQTTVLVISSPLQPTGNGDAPGQIPFRTLNSTNAGKIPVTRR